MKRILLFVAACSSLVVAKSFAQGTLEDYRRAYGLYEKMKSQNVTHWASDVAWKDSSHVFTYRVQTSEGESFVAYDADTRTAKSFASVKERNEYLGIQEKKREERRQPFGRHHQRHWMEVDEENTPFPVVSPDGKQEVYIEGQNVVLHQVGTPYTTKRILTQDGTLSNYYSNRLTWSPDGRYVAVCKRRPVEKRYVYYVESSPKDQLQPILHKQEYAKPGDELPFKQPCIIEVGTGRVVALPVDLFEHQYDLEGFSWTPDSKELLFEFNERGHKHYRVLAASPETGQVRVVVEESSNTFVNYNRRFRQDICNGTQMIWMSERDNWNHLYLYDIKKGKMIRQITKGEWCIRRVLDVDEKNGVIYFTACGVNKNEDPYLVHYYKIGIDGKNFTCLTPAEGNHSAVMSRDKTLIVDTYSKVDAAPVTELRSVKDGSLIATVERADISKLQAAGWRSPEVFCAKGRDGKTDIWGVIQRPTNFDPQKKYPVIEYIYAGPGDAYAPKSFMSYNWNMTPLAELGFIVVQLDGMGTSWRGKAFEEVCYKNLKDAGFPDRKAWIKAAAEKYPYMDADNVGIFGASAGGQESTTAVLLHGDFYKAAYSSCGCHDNRMDKIWWNEQWMSYPIDSSYVECSNVYNAHKLERPLMLVVGELDDNVDPASTMQVVDALIKANKDFELVVLPGVHHTMGESYGEHKRFDFFVKNLLGVNPPKWSDIKK